MPSTRVLLGSFRRAYYSLLMQKKFFIYLLTFYSWSFLQIRLDFYKKICYNNYRNFTVRSRGENREESPSITEQGSC